MSDGESAGAAAPSAGIHSLLQDGLGLSPLDYHQSTPVQPFPRSPKLQRKAAKAAAPSQEQLVRRLEELQAEGSRTEAHLRSLKKRRADLSETTEAMKQQVRDRFESLHRVLRQDEQDVLDSLELDLRGTRAKLDQVLRDWEQHRDQVRRGISCMEAALSRSPDAREDGESQDSPGPKRPDASEEGIRLNEDRFQRLLRTLSSISRTLRAQLERKTLLLDWSSVALDRQTSHWQLEVSPDGRSACFSAAAAAAPAAQRPLQFDRVCCALGSAPLAAARSYWEVDVRCCGAWAVGVAYARLDRKGRDKGAKLGRNRNSWCVELRGGSLAAWHNDRHVACRGAGRAPPGRVGVWVNYERGQLVFYDADAMAELQRFSAAVTPVFDRAHHQFTEPLYPAVRLLRPPQTQAWPNHLQLCPPEAAL
ncbi:E3 ubiquitin-protein ligase TRIM50 [Salarias fasciatus]|uniref:E3 ubiquitin-protein ligase TRIM50 n=1 Tax=Salarias fasciatus TaxID=181472 RepID=UPI001176A25D|nr:E3 ubiquitin-protein ligase TRIM50-like [Salarias fasciatus]